MLANVLPAVYIGYKAYQWYINKHNKLVRAVERGDIQDVKNCMKLFKLRWLNFFEKDESGQPLFWKAVLSRNIEMINLLLIDYKFDPNITDSTGKNVFILLATQHIGDLELEILKLLIKLGANPKAMSMYQNRKTTALHMLISTPIDTKNWEIRNYDRPVNLIIQWIDLLIENGIDINTKDEFGQTPLHYAARRSKLDHAEKIIIELMNRGADAKAKDKWEKKPIDYVDKKDGGLKSLLIYGITNFSIRDSKNNTLLHDAVKYKYDVKALGFLLENGIDVNAVNSDGNSALHYAARKGLPNHLKYLIDRGGNVNLKNKKGETPSHHACMSAKYVKQKEKIKCLEYLKDKNADLNAIDKDHNSILHYAISYSILDSDISYNYNNIVSWLLDKGVSVNIRNKALQTPLHLYRRVNKHPIGINIINIDDIITIIKKGIDINARDYNGNTVLHLCVKALKYNITNFYKQTTQVQEFYYLFYILLKQGANTCIQNNKGKTVEDLLEGLINYNKLTDQTKELAEIFLNTIKEANRCYTEGAIFEICQNTIPTLPAEISRYISSFIDRYTAEKVSKACPQVFRNTLAILKQSFKYDFNKYTANNGDSLLHYAVKYNHWLLVDWLLKKRVNTKVVNKLKQTPLHIYLTQFTDESFVLSKYNYINQMQNFIQKLVNGGIEVNAQDSDGNTALHLTIKVLHKFKNHIEKFSYQFYTLLRLGANPYIKNNKNQDIFDVIKETITDKDVVNKLVYIIQKADYYYTEGAIYGMGQSTNHPALPAELTSHISKFVDGNTGRNVSRTCSKALGGALANLRDKFHSKEDSSFNIKI